MVKVLSLRERVPQYGTLREIGDGLVNPMINHAIRLVSEYPVEPLVCRNCGAPERLGARDCKYCGAMYRSR